MSKGPRAGERTTRLLIVDGPEADWPVIARALGQKGFALVADAKAAARVRGGIAESSDAEILRCKRVAQAGVGTSNKSGRRDEPRPPELTAGTLAAGVAHEINNPLASVIANLDLALGAVDRLTAQTGAAPARPPMAELRELRAGLNDAQAAAGHVHQIVRAVRVFVRPETEALEAVDVGQVIDLALRMTSSEVRARARLCEERGETPAVRTTALRLGQVFVNLLVNAAQAIEAGNPELHEIRIVTRTDERGWAEVAISDSGVGIAEENLARVFVPFFTTKPAGIGTGLGLPICQRIVDELGGRITLTSRAGAGTTVTVSLPPAARVTQS